MGYAMCFAPCIACGKVFGFNPHKVPSIVVKGVREPVCKECMDACIEREKAAGIIPKPYHPDAYSSIPEEEL